MPLKRFQTFHDVFVLVEKAQTKKEKVAILREHSCAALKAVLGYTYDPNVKWMLPAGVPPYTPLPAGADQEGRLVSEVRKFYLFVDGPTETQKNISSARREKLFIEMLEVVDPNDAKVLLGMKDRRLPYRGLTRKLVAEAFPTISKNW